MSSVLHHKPANVTEFLIQELQNQKTATQVALFTNDDFACMFRLIDVEQTGRITREQFVQCLQNLHLPLKYTQEAEKMPGAFVPVDQFCNLMYEHVRVFFDICIVTKHSNKCPILDDNKQHCFFLLHGNKTFFCTWPTFAFQQNTQKQRV